MARLFSAGNEAIVTASLKKLMAVRYYKRMQEVGDLQDDRVRWIMREAGTTPEEAEEIYLLTAVPTVHKRYVLPPLQREEAIGSMRDVQDCKGSCGFGTTSVQKGMCNADKIIRIIMPGTGHFYAPHPQADYLSVLNNLIDSDLDKEIYEIFARISRWDRRSVPIRATRALYTHI